MSGYQPPRKPGDRFETVDSVPEDAVNDVDFQRAVQRLEEQQSNRAGWLFARGAFDKGDQAFIREQQEKMHHAEEAQLERERTEFLAARLRAEGEQRQRAAAGAEASAAKVTVLRKQQEAERKKRLATVKIKPVSAPGDGCGASAAKKPRMEAVLLVPEEATATVAALGHERGKAAGAGEEPQEDGLGGLLGDYGSDSEGGDVGDAADGARREDTGRNGAGRSSARPHEPDKGTGPGLPSAADLLNG